MLPLLLLSVISCSQTPAPKYFTDEALNEKMTTLEGTQIAFKDILAKHSGKTIVIDVWASWCPDCIKGMPKVHSLQKQFPEAVYVFLSYDREDAAWKRGIEKYDVNGEHYHVGNNMKKGAFSEAVKLDWIPRYMVIDSKGEIVLFKAVEADDEKLIATLKQLK